MATARDTDDPHLLAAALTTTAKLTPRELNDARRAAAAALRALAYEHDLALADDFVRADQSHCRKSGSCCAG